MADEAPAVPALAPEAAPAAPVAPAPVAAPIPQPVVAAPPAPVRAPDSVTLTQRELDERISAAVLKAADTLRKERMSTEQPKPEITPPAPVEDPRIAKLAEQMASLQAASEAAARELAETKTALAMEKKAKQRAKEKAVEAQLRAEAATAGIDDVDYALVLYARAASAAVNAKDEKGESAGQAPPQPDEFFKGLRASKPGIFKVLQPATTAPADLPGTNGAPNAPNAPGSSARDKVETVDEMDQQTFGRHAIDKYNFNPFTSS